MEKKIGTTILIRGTTKQEFRSFPLLLPEFFLPDNAKGQDEIMDRIHEFTKKDRELRMVSPISGGQTAGRAAEGLGIDLGVGVFAAQQHTCQRESRKGGPAHVRGQGPDVPLRRGVLAQARDVIQLAQVELQQGPPAVGVGQDVGGGGRPQSGFSLR